MVVYPLGDATKKKLNKNSDCWSRDMFKFSFSEKCLSLVLPPHFVHCFSLKMFFMFYSLNWLSFISWLPLFLTIFYSTCIATACLPGCGVINFEINLICLIKPFCQKTKKSRKKLKYLEKKNLNSFWGEIKSIFHHFKRAFSCWRGGW